MSKGAWLAAAIGMLGILASRSVNAADAERIEPQPLNAALRVFAEQSGLQLVYLADVTDGVRSGGSDASEAPDRALTQLLADTGLNYRFINARTVAIERSADPGKSPRPPLVLAGADASQPAVPSSRLRLAALPTPAPVESERSEVPRQLQEVIVSTRKRQESLQSVPIAVGALSAEQIFRKGIANLEEVTQQSPSMILDKGAAPQDLKIVVRGLSPTRGRQNVAVLLDGIDISSESLVTAGGSLLIDPKIFDIERIEVVKGPQNALYGRSAFAGAISYVSRLPGAEFRGGTDLEVGSDGQAQLRARASGPLAGETLGGSLDAMAWTHDGYYRNSITHAGIGGQNGVSVAGTLVWRPAPSLSVTGRISYEDSAHEIAAYAHPAPTAVFSVPAAARGTIVDASFPTIRGVRGTAPDARNLSVTISADPRTGRDYEGDDQQVLRSTLTVVRDLESLPLVGATTLTSLTHYADTRSFQNQDANDFGSAAVLPVFGEIWFKNDTRLFSQELRWQSRDEQGLKWTAGALFWQEQTDFLDGSLSCINYIPPFISLAAGAPCGPYIAAVGTTRPRNADRWLRDTDHWSIYGLADWAFASNWNVIAEARFVDESLKVGGPDIDNSIIDPFGVFGGPPVLSPAAAGLVRGKDSDHFFAPKATLQWQAAADRMVYLSIAQGIKPSGISTVTGGVGAFDPEANRFEAEKVRVYELGAKTDWAARTVRLNGAVFFQDFTDKQVTGQIPDTSGILRSKVFNANAEVWGLEAELTWLATDHLTLAGAYTFLDTKYTEFRQLTTSPGTIAYTGACRLLTFATPTCEVSYTGNELENAPRHAFVGSASYRRTLGNGMEGFIEVDATYRGSRFTNQTNLLKYGSYWVADFRAGLSSERWDVVAYVDNALDDDTVKSGFNSGGYLADYAVGFAPFTFVLPDSGQYVMPTPRTFGVRVSYRFGGR